MKLRTLLWIIPLAIGLYFLGTLAVAERTNSPAVPSPSASAAPGASQTFQGHLICLQHKGSGMHTLECAIGIQTTDGHSYGLDNSALADQSYTQTAFTTPITVTGSVTSDSQLSKTYDISGVIKVTAAAVK